MQFCSAFNFLSVFSPSSLNLSWMAAAWKIKLNMRINVFCRTIIENIYLDIYFHFLKISVRDAALQLCSPPSWLAPESKHSPMHLFLKYLCLPLNRRNQVSHLYKKQLKLSVIIFLSIKWEDKGFWIKCWYTFSRCTQILISSIDTRIKNLVYFAKYWNLKCIH